MGFRCLLCHEDFGYDRKALDKHMGDCSDGIAKDLADKYIEIVESNLGRKKEMSDE